VDRPADEEGVVNTKIDTAVVRDGINQLSILGSPLRLQVLWKSIKELEASIPNASPVRKVVVRDVEVGPEGGEPVHRSHYIIKREFSEGAVHLFTIIIPTDLLTQVRS
jgi:hypothetical protein